MFFNFFRRLVLSLFLVTMISCKLQAQEITNKKAPCYITWRRGFPTPGALQGNRFAYFFNKNYVGANESGLNKILTHLKKLKGTIVYIEVPYLGKMKKYPSLYPGITFPFLGNKGNSHGLINALRHFDVELEFNYSNVLWPKEKAKTMEWIYDANWQKNYNKGLKNKLINKGNIKKVNTDLPLEISWQRLKNNSCKFFYNDKLVGMDKIGYDKIIQKIKAYRGNNIYIKFPHIDKENTSANTYSIPFFMNSKFTTSGNLNLNAVYDVEDFIPLIKSKGLTVKLKFCEKELKPTPSTNPTKPLTP